MKTRKERKPKPTKFAIWWKWPLIVLALSFVLSLAFGIVSEVALSEAGLAVSIVVILIFILIAIIVIVLAIVLFKICTTTKYSTDDVKNLILKGAENMDKLLVNGSLKKKKQDSTCKYYYKG